MYLASRSRYQVRKIQLTSQNETYNVTVGGVTGVGTINDDDAAPTISSVTSDAQTEGTSLYPYGDLE